MIAGLKPYPDYKHTSAPWLGLVPSHWSVLPNRALFAEVKDRNRPDEEMLSVTITRGVIRQRALLSDSSKKDSSNLNKSAYKVVCPGDIAYNKMRAWQGAIGVSGYRGIVSPAYVVMRLRDDHNSKYFHELYRTPHFAKEAERWSYGITSDMWSLRPEHFKMIYSALPPHKEQNAIVRFLAHANRRIERYIRAKKKLIALLNEQKQVIVHRAVTRGLDPNVRLKPSGIPWLGDISEHWEVMRLKWVTRLQRGYDLPQDRRLAGEIPVVSSGGAIDTHLESRANGPGIVMGRYGSTDNVFFIETDFWPHNTALFVTDFYDNDRKWCFYLLKTISKADYASKSAVPGVDRKDLYEIYVTRPPRDEQVLIVKGLEAELKLFDSAITRTEREIALLREYKTRLVADVITGKLDVREAAAKLPDEPKEEEVEPVEEENGEEPCEFEDMGDSGTIA
jgi:type I restriction enzyme S subunit